MHTLAGYFREAGAEVTTLRAGFDPALLDELPARPRGALAGPGPPSDFGCDALLTALDDRGIAAFGVCLGMQAMVEHAGGQLGLLDTPVHGKPGTVRVLGGPATCGCWPASPPSSPPGGTTRCTPRPDRSRAGSRSRRSPRDGVVMAIEDDVAGRWGVQFHPESILTASGRAGHQVIGNVLRLARARSRDEVVSTVS